jgi:hypothetical protein
MSRTGRLRKACDHGRDPRSALTHGRSRCRGTPSQGPLAVLEQLSESTA